MNLILNNKGKLASFVLGAGGLFVCYLVKGETKVGYDFLREILVTPNLGQETSRMGLFDILSHPIKTLQKLKPTKKDVMDNIIMDPEIQQKLRSIVDQMNLILYNTGKLAASFVLGAGVFFLCYFLVKGGYDFLRTRLVTPDLVQETSRIGLFEVMSHPIKTLQKLKPTKKDVMDNIIMNPKVEQRLRDVAIRIKQSVPYQLTQYNVLLYGPPGTGKTMVARLLAKYSGLDYAILNGFDLAGMGKHAIPKLDTVFDWCEASRKGVILFIDEADSFLASREDTTEGMAYIRSVFLSRTRSESNRFSVVFSTSYPAELDEEILNRVATLIPLPTFDERKSG